MMRYSCCMYFKRSGEKCVFPFIKRVSLLGGRGMCVVAAGVNQRDEGSVIGCCLPILPGCYVDWPEGV